MTRVRGPRSFVLKLPTEQTLLGEALLVSGRSCQGRATLADQLSMVGFDVTSITDANTAWVHLRAWQHIRTEVPRVAVIDASPLCTAGRALFTRLVTKRRRPGVRLVVLAGAAPLDGVIPGMIVVPLPCRCQQVTMRVLRVAGVLEDEASELVQRQRFWTQEGSGAWMPGRWEDKEEARIAASIQKR